MRRRRIVPIAGVTIAAIVALAIATVWEEIEAWVLRSVESEHIDRLQP